MQQLKILVVLVFLILPSIASSAPLVLIDSLGDSLDTREDPVDLSQLTVRREGNFFTVEVSFSSSSPIDSLAQFPDQQLAIVLDIDVESPGLLDSGVLTFFDSFTIFSTGDKDTFREQDLLIRSDETSFLGGKASISGSLLESVKDFALISTDIDSISLKVPTAIFPSDSKVWFAASVIRGDDIIDGLYDSNQTGFAVIPEPVSVACWISLGSACLIQHRLW